MDIRLKENLNNIQQNYIAPFLWLHGEDDELIINELNKIYESGIRSVCLESRTHEGFVRDGWWHDVGVIFEHCKKMDMNVWILDDKHFPSGYANGIFAKKHRDLQPWCITEQHMDIVGPVKDGAAMCDCWLYDKSDEIIGAVALKHVPNTEKYSEAIDITTGISNGMVYFTLPEGMWRIVFLIKTRRGFSKYFAAFSDLLNKETIKMYIDEVYEPHYEHFKEYFGNTFLGFFSDEPGFRNNSVPGLHNFDFGTPFIFQPWSGGIKCEFERLYNNMALPYLSGLWFDIDNVSSDARYAFMEHVTKQYRDNFCNTIAEWCHSHNISYIGHIIEDNNYHSATTWSVGHYFRALDGQDMSGIDVVLHQIIPGLSECANAGLVSYRHMNNKFFNYVLAKLGSSMAHIDAKKKGRAMCEIFGAYGWAEGTKIMKYLMDHMLVRGINYFVPHAFSPKPNDSDCPPNFYDSGENPLFKFFKYHMDYLNRVAHMLSGGTHISNCAILYDAELRWTNREYTHEEDIAKVLCDNLLDYDIIPADYIDKMDENGFLNGEKYDLILVPYAKNIPPEIREKLERCMVKTVCVSNDDIDGCINTDAIADYLKQNGYFDIKSDYNGIYLRYCHYRRNGADIYMFVNEDVNNTINAKVYLNGFDGGEYVVYDAYENKAYRANSHNGEVLINLAPYNSVLIITGDADVKGIVYKSDYDIEYTVINPIYDIYVSEQNSENYVPYSVTQKLESITSAKNLPDFSGTVRYDFNVDLTDENAVIDFEYVGEAAELYVNDECIGVKTYPPYTFDMSKFAIKGKNKVRLFVTNHNGYNRRDAFSKYLLFEPSGLLGNVKIGYKH